MLKTVKRIDQSTPLKAEAREEFHRSGHTETKISSLFNIDPHPESEKPPKIDLKLHQLEDYE